MILTPAAAEPFDWLAFAGFLDARAIPGVEEIEGDLYRRSVVIDRTASVLEIERAGRGIRVEVAETAAADGMEPRLRRWLDLDADIVTIDKHLAHDPLLGPLVAARPGLRVPGAWDPFELAVRAIVGQQISVAGARTIAGRLVERAGDRLPNPRGRVVALFPRPEQLAAANLDAIGMPGARVRSIVALAGAVAADPSLLRATEDLDADVAQLRTLPGIGEWTAQYIALRGLKHSDAFPASDLGLLRAMAHERGRRPTPAEALARAEAWRPYRAYAAQHLWSAAS